METEAIASAKAGESVSYAREILRGLGVARDPRVRAPRAGASRDRRDDSFVETLPRARETRTPRTRESRGRDERENTRRDRSTHRANSTRRSTASWTDARELDWRRIETFGGRRVETSGGGVFAPTNARMRATALLCLCLWCAALSLVGGGGRSSGCL